MNILEQSSQRREDVLNFIEDLLDEGDLSQALFVSEQHLKRYPDDPEALLLCGHVQIEAGNFEAALENYMRAQELVPDWEDAALIHAGVLLDLGHLEESKQALSELVKSHPDNAHIHHTLAIALEFSADQLGAQRHYQQAARLNPQHYAMPFRISDDQLNHLAHKALEHLTQFKLQLDGEIQLEVVEHPELERTDRNGRPLSPLTLGYAARGVDNQQQISLYLFKRNIERVCGNLAEIKEQLEITLEHELTHVQPPANES